jgi:hypothetical protein
MKERGVLIFAHLDEHEICVVVAETEEGNAVWVPKPAEYFALPPPCGTISAHYGETKKYKRGMVRQ